MRVAIVLALAVGLCVGCGPMMAPPGVCPATSAAVQGQLTMRSSMRMYSSLERLSCAPFATGDTSVYCSGDTGGVGFTVTIKWPEQKLATLRVFDTNGATAVLDVTASASTGTSTVVTSGGSDVPNRRELVITGLLCDGTTDPSVFVGADLNRFRVLLPAGL